MTYQLPGIYWGSDDVIIPTNTIPYPPPIYSSIVITYPTGGEAL